MVLRLLGVHQLELDERPRRRCRNGHVRNLTTQLTARVRRRVDVDVRHAIADPVVLLVSNREAAHDLARIPSKAGQAREKLNDRSSVGSDLGGRVDVGIRGNVAHGKLRIDARLQER